MIASSEALRVVREMQSVDAPRTHRYVSVLDDRMDAWLAHLDLEQLPFGELSPTTIRLGTEVTGYMAMCWANPRSRFYHDDRLLRHARARLLAFAESHVEGEIRWPAAMLASGFGRTYPARQGHGNAWYLEPLILAALWIGEELTDEQRGRIDAMIRRAADLHAAYPYNYSNNRGVVRNAVLALAGRYLQDPHLVDIAMRDFHLEPIRVLNGPRGEMAEGIGPDGNYSGTSMMYLYIYRLFSGDSSIDEKMVDALRWFTWVADNHGYPTLFGPSVRVPMPGETKVQDYLPGLERWGQEHPHFSWLLDNGYLQGQTRAGNHSVSPMLWAMLEHSGSEGVEDPQWFTPAGLKNYSPDKGPEFMFIDEVYGALYWMFKGNYHASTTGVGSAPFKGMQHWSWQHEAPVVWPVQTRPSRTLGWGMNSSRRNLSGIHFRDSRWIEGSPNALVLRYDDVWHHYMLTETTLLLLISSALSPREDIWVMDRGKCGEPIISDGLVSYAGRQGRMFFAGAGQHELIEHDDAYELVLRDMGTTALYAFSNESFRLLDFEDGLVRFADDTGKAELTYEIDLTAGEDSKAKGYRFHMRTHRVHTEVRRV